MTKKEQDIAIANMYDELLPKLKLRRLVRAEIMRRFNILSEKTVYNTIKRVKKLQKATA